MLPTDPKSFRQSDQSMLDALYERNVRRIREIEAVLAELEPTMTRLLGERDACFAVIQRCTPQDSGTQTCQTQEKFNHA